MKSNPFSENHQRHYFKVPLPEELKSGPNDEATAYMDLHVEQDVVLGQVVIVDEWAVIFDGAAIQPDWVTPKQIEDEKTRVHFRIRKAT